MLSLLFLSTLLQIADKKLDRLCRELRTSKQVSERVKAAQQLGELGAAATGCTGDLCAGLVDKAPTVRQAASEALEKVNPSFREAVLPIVVDDKVGEPIKRIDALREDGLPFKASNAVPPVTYRFTIAIEGLVQYRVISLENEAISCLRTMAKLGPEDKDVVALTMTAAASSLSESVRRASLEFLPALKIEDPKRAVKVLLNAVKDDTDANKIVTIGSLAKLGSASKDVLFLAMFSALNGRTNCRPIYKLARSAWNRGTSLSRSM